MPVYEYLCEGCGPFTAMRPMAEFEAPLECPDCGASAPRVMLTPPRFSALAADVRLAHMTNERSANAPRNSRSLGGKHPSGCACCSANSGRLTLRGKDGSKSFPTKRPWMISH
jgi:putative FmdB family regulatory protein